MSPGKRALERVLYRLENDLMWEEDLWKIANRYDSKGLKWAADVFERHKSARLARWVVKGMLSEIR